MPAPSPRTAFTAVRTDAGSSELVQRVCIELSVSALEHVQVTFATLLDNPLEILCAAALLALGPLTQIAVGRLWIIPTRRHDLTPFVIPNSALRQSA
jgi:Zn-dependent protease